MRTSNLLNFLNPAAPKGLVPSARDWVLHRVASAAQMRQPQPAAWAREVFPAEDNFRVLPYPLESTPGEEFSSVRWTASTPATLFYLRGCRVLGAEGAVISPDNRMFAEFTLPPGDRWLEHSCFRRRRVPAAKPLRGWYATIAWPESRFFFHWMAEALPRMAVLGDFTKILDGLFVPSPLQNYHRESLRRLGIDDGKLIPLDADSHFKPEHLFVPHAFAMYNPPRWLHAWFKGAYLQQGPAAQPPTARNRRIYVSRTDAPVRRVANESEVLQVLDRFGFVSVRLSEHTFDEQARIFNEADIIVGPHGAGLSNVVFCREQTLLIEVMPPRWMAPCFMVLALSAGCRYRHLVAEEIDRTGPSDSQRDDIRLPIHALERLLEAALH